MNIYYLSQDVNTDYDTYDSMVVYAETEEHARQILPHHTNWGERYGSWANKPEEVKVSYLGTAPHVTTPGIILASFNAG